jgi:penicillin-binding protein 2
MNQRSRLNLLFIQVLVISLLAALLGRLFYLQIANTGAYKTAALSIQSRDVVTPAVRGAIVDSQGVPLAVDRPGMVITVDRSIIDRRKDKGESVLAKVALLLGKKYPDIYRATRLCGEILSGNKTGCWNGTRYQPIPVTRDATEKEALKVLENSDLYPGVDASPVPIRSYPSLAGENGSHVLGYVGSVTEQDLANTSQAYYRNENIGKSGLEYQYNKFLRGSPGVKTVIVDRREAVTSLSRDTQPIPGDNLVTNLNAKLQAATEKALASSVARSKSLGYRADSGAAIVMDIHTGQILSIASWPTYDPTIWEKGLTTAQAAALYSVKNGVPALSRPVQGMYAPASTFKSLSVAAAANAGYDLQKSYDCPAQVKIGNRYFKNFEAKSQGRLTMQNAIAVSCDTIWYQIAYDEWVRDGGLFPKSGLHDYFFKSAASFGLGKVTGIDLPAEATGRLPDRSWKQRSYEANKSFYCNFKERARKSDLTPYLIAIAHENCLDGDKIRAGDAVNFAIGQGDTLMTPLQMVAAYAAIANGGTLYQPQIAKAIVKPNGTVVKQFSPVINGHIDATPATIAFLHKALRSVNLVGTGAGVFSNFPVAVSGKTGTGQVFGKNPDGSSYDDISWYSSFAPSEKPEYAVVMVVSQGGFGATTSAVGVRDIYSALFGVSGSTVDPAKSVFPNGLPKKLPVINTKLDKLELIIKPKASPTPAASSLSTKKAVKP